MRRLLACASAAVLSLVPVALGPGSGAAAAQPGGTGCPLAARSTVDPAVEPPAQERLRIRDAHRYATGVNQRVAVIDSGVNPSQILPAGRLVDGGTLIGRGGLADCQGHGTLVAGLIAAGDFRNLGLVGVAPAAQIISIRQTDTFSKERQDAGTLAAAVRSAIAQRATVINISIAGCFPAGGTEQDGGALQDAIRDAVNGDIVVVAAAGNLDPNGKCDEQNPRVGPPVTMSAPARYDDDVLTVASIDTSSNSETGAVSGQISSFSLNGPWVDVAAPGTDIVSIGLDGSVTNLIATTGNTAVLVQGTSFATPYVAGLAALVREKFPDLTAREVVDRIERTAQDLAPGQADGGIGVVDPIAALTHVLTPGVAAQNVEPASLDFKVHADDDDTPRNVAIGGSVAALAALAVIGATVYTLNRRRRETAGPES